tara:strand:+ start:220 stop:756 length:537 start_codon:yes stop_codon:yes gene_type:complete
MTKTTPQKVANAVIDLTGLDVFKDTRQREYVETRALLSTMLHDDLGMGWSRIAEFFQANGKRMNHATVIHAVKNYPIYKQHNKKLQKLEGCFNFSKEISEENVNTTLNLQNSYENLQYQYVKLEEKLKSPMISLMYDIPEDKWSEVIERIDILKKSWEWKNRDNCLVVESSEGIKNTY